MIILKHSKWVAILILFVIISITSAGWAKTFGPGRHMRTMGGGITGLKTFIELNLSETQQTAFKQILEKYQEKGTASRTDLRDARYALSNLLRSEESNETEIRSAHRRVSSIEEDLMILRIQMRSELKALLTPEQVTQLEEKKGERMAGVRQRLEKRLEQWDR